MVPTIWWHNSVVYKLFVLDKPQEGSGAHWAKEDVGDAELLGNVEGEASKAIRNHASHRRHPRGRPIEPLQEATERSSKFLSNRTAERVDILGGGRVWWGEAVGDCLEPEVIQALESWRVAAGEDSIVVELGVHESYVEAFGVEELG